MSLSHGASLVKNGLVLSLDAANPLSRLGQNLISNPQSTSTYTANQNVTISNSGQFIRVVSNQTTSTPGVYPIGGAISVTSNTQYTFRVKAHTSAGTATMGGYIWGNVTGQIAYTTIVDGTHEWKEIRFVTGASDTQVQVGILWSGPTLNSTVLIEDLGLYKTATWTGLSGTQNASMMGNVPFSSADGGAYDFSALPAGVTGDSPLGFTFSSMMISTTGSFTISAWIKQTINSGQTGLFSNAGGGNGFRFGPSDGTIYYLCGPTYKEGNVSGGGHFSLNQWAHISCVFDRASTRAASPCVYGYVNGVLRGSVIQDPQTEFTTVTPGINRNPCCTRFIGYLSVFTVHSRALTDAETLQNFEAHRDRYGV